MKKNEVSKTPDEPICEFGIGPDQGRLYIVRRGFYLKTRIGPLESVKVSQLVRLEATTAEILFFAGKIEPSELAETFEVIHDFCSVENGEFVPLEKGDVLKLSRDEAIPLLRTQRVKERKGGSVDAAQSA